MILKAINDEPDTNEGVIRNRILEQLHVCMDLQIEKRRHILIEAVRRKDTTTI